MLSKSFQLLPLALLAFILSACTSTEQDAEYAGRDWYNTPNTNSSPQARAAGQSTVMVTGRVPNPGSYTITPTTTLENVLRQAGWTPDMETGFSGVTTVIISRFIGNQEYEWVTRDEYVTQQDWQNFQLKNADIIKVKIFIF